MLVLVPKFRRLFRFFCFIFPAFVFFAKALGGTITVGSNVLGQTPVLVGYDSGHFYPGGNTADWWRYSGVTGARMFVSPGNIEPVAQFPAIASTVTNEASFLNLKSAVRANPWNPAYLNWSYVTNQFATKVLSGTDSIVVDYALSNLETLGIQTVIDTTASTTEFSIATWPGQWQLWQYYYQEAFYLGYAHNIQRYQMYNEPDDGGPTGTNYLTRLQLASDAIQCAVADVNTMYGKALTPMIFAPVTAGAPTSSYSTWGQLVVTNRHNGIFGQYDPDFNLIQKYDYHEYGGSPPNPAGFASNLGFLQTGLSRSMAPESPYPVTISEFNVYDGSVFNGLSTTLDTPLNYSALGAIACALISGNINEIYCFKISQTVGSGYPAKNGTHFVDNTNAPYNIGGITKGGEVWRLLNKALAPGRTLLGDQTDSQTAPLTILNSFDPVAQVYHSLIINYTSGAIPLTVNLSNWNIPSSNQVFMEAVNENCYGGGWLFTNASHVSTTENAYSALLLTVPAKPQQPVASITASASAQVSDGVNKNINFSGRTNLVIADSSTNSGNRISGLLQFKVPPANLNNLQLAILTLTASSANGAPTNQCYVYGIVNNNWSENSVTWADAPNLAQNVPAGIAYTNDFVLGAGNTAFLLGQLVAGATPSQYTFDVTSFVKSATNSTVSFLLAQQVRFYGDAQNGGLCVVSREDNSNAVPTLQLVSTFVPTVSLLSPRMQSSNTLNFTLQGTPGYNYAIQSTTNFVQWISQQVVSNTGSVQVTVTNASPLPSAEYYRAVLQQ